MILKILRQELRNGMRYEGIHVVLKPELAEEYKVTYQESMTQ